MYDCVYPTRTARFGTALVPEVVSFSACMIFFCFSYYRIFKKHISNSMHTILYLILASYMLYVVLNMLMLQSLVV